MSLTAEYLEQAIARVAEEDAHVRQAVKLVGLPEPRIRPAGFPALLRIMVAQQLSVKAAATIHRRLEALMGEVTPEHLLAQTDEALRTAGLSRQKVVYARALADACAQGQLDFPAIGRLGDDDAITALSSVKGFGRWSAEIYLMFCEGRPDIWPSADLGLQAGLHRLKTLGARPTARETIPLVEPWRPHRSAMALFLWHYYARTAAPLG
jgi:DNA-3-methyladenine glycosylase II